jgi:hypothetical protein
MPLLKHRDLEEPSEHQILWRYMDFPKFISLIQTNKLYFAAMSQLDSYDPWEGYPSRLNLNPHRSVEVTETYGDDSVKNYTATMSDLIKENLPFFNPEEFMEKQRIVNEKLRNIFFVNCWHMNDSESDSQWRIYGQNDSSVAIVTSLKKLKNSLASSKTEIYGSSIKYYDPKKEVTPDLNVLWNCSHKRNAFSHEKEFRMIIMDGKHYEKELVTRTGQEVDVDLNELIHEVIVSPRAADWFVETVKSAAKDYDLKCKVSKSDLLSPY